MIEHAPCNIPAGVQRFYEDDARTGVSRRVYRNLYRFDSAENQLDRPFPRRRCSNVSNDLDAADFGTRYAILRSTFELGEVGGENSRG